MTTTVTIAAHLSNDKEVKVHITNKASPIETFTLQDGEVAERCVYDGHEINVKEVIKNKENSRQLAPSFEDQLIAHSEAVYKAMQVAKASRGE